MHHLGLLVYLHLNLHSCIDLIPSLLVAGKVSIEGNQERNPKSINSLPKPKNQRRKKKSKIDMQVNFLEGKCNWSLNIVQCDQLTSSWEANSVPLQRAWKALQYRSFVCGTQARLREIPVLKPQWSIDHIWYMVYMGLVIHNIIQPCRLVSWHGIWQLCYVDRSNKLGIFDLFIPKIFARNIVHPSIIPLNYYW